MTLRLYPTRLLARRAIRKEIEGKGHFAGGSIKGWAEALSWMHLRLPNPTPVADLLTARRLMAVAWDKLGAHPAKARWMGSAAPEGLVRLALDLAARLRNHNHSLRHFHDKARQMERPRCKLAGAWLLAWERLMREARLTDRTGMAVEAVEGLESGALAWPAEFPLVELHGFVDCDPLMLRWMKALVSQGVALEWKGRYPVRTASEKPDEEPDEERAFMDRLLASADRTLRPIEDQFVEMENVGVTLEEMALKKGLTFFTAPDRYLEIEEIGRRIRVLIEQRMAMPGDIAIIVPSLNSYLEMTADIFQRFNIPLYVRVGIPARNDAAMRWAESLVRWAVTGCPVEEWPALAHSPWMNPPATGACWSALATGLLPWLAEARAAQGPMTGHLERLRHAADEQPGRRAMFKVMERFLDLRREWDSARRAGEHSRMTLKALDLAGAFSSGGLDAPRRAAVEKSMERLVRVVRQCGEEHRAMTAAEWLAAWQSTLGETTLHSFSREEDAVNLLTFDEAAGLHFNHSFMAGLIEGDWPAVRQPNPLFGDGDAFEFGDRRLCVGNERADREAWLFALALEKAEEATLSYPAVDTEESHPTVPSRFFTAALARAGLEMDKIQRLRRSDPMPHPWRAAEPLEHFASLVATVQGHAAISQDQLKAIPIPDSYESRWRRLGRIQSACRERDQFFLDADARPGVHAGRASALNDFLARPVAAKSIEEMAGCAFQWAVRKVLQTAPLEKPGEDPTRMEAGTWLHLALEQLYAPWAGGEAVSPARLQGRVEECVRNAWLERIGGDPNLPGNRFQIERMAGRITNWIALEADAGAFKVLSVEKSIGMRGQPPLALSDGEGEVLVRGQVDRLDRLLDDARLRVVEFKNSKSLANYVPLMRQPGLRGFQLALYMLAATREEESALAQDAVLGAYALLAEPALLVSDKKTREKSGFWDGLESEAAFTGRTLALVRRIARGEWAPRPDDEKRCDRCDVARLCRRVWVRPSEASAQSPDQSDSQ